MEDETPPIEDETPQIPLPSSTGSEDKDNKPLPPEIMKADSDSPLSPQEPVLAATESGAAESGAALLTVTISNGGELLPFTDANGFASEGGSVAVISLSRAAAALFTADGLVMSLVLTATNAGGTVLSTVSFASSALGIDGAGLTLHLTTALLRSETELFAATDASLTIWHNGDKEEKYELSGLGWELFTVGADGGVRVADDLPVSGEGALYGLTLRLTDGAADAERSLSLRLTPPRTETTPPRTETPPLPEIEGELLGETKLVNALSGSGTALLAVTVSNGGALLSFADANGFASEGGAVAVISLARSATALFTLDGLTLSLALTATNAGGTVSETVSFASSARGFDGLGLSLHLTTALLRPETELFAAADANLTIWHNDDKKESYELSGLDSELFAAGADGGVKVASDLPVPGEGAFYELTLRLTDGAAIAERLLFLRLTPPLPEIEGVSGETKLVNALSGSGTALLAVTVSNGGALSPFADANGFASDGGAVAVISLARSATALFTLDGLTLSLALTATNAGRTVSETVSFASSARGFDGLGLSLHLTTALLRPETELFAAADSRLTIWHNDGKEESYELSGLDSELFAADADGGVRVGSDLPVSGEGAFYELTLRLTDGSAVAERSLFLRLTPPLPEIEGVSGETKLVNALSGSGTALLAVTVSNGGALSPFADAGFASGGGAVAVISLARPATALFTLDGLTLSLTLTATNAGGTVSETVSFASSARGFDGLGLSLHLTTALLRSGAVLFAAADSRLTIWHNDGKKESYELSGLDSQLFAAGADGGVRVAGNLPVSGEGAFYELTLRLTDGAAVAERLLFLRLTPPPPEIEGVSGETKLVDALSGSGTALLTVTVSNGGALSPFANVNGFASGGGAVAVISLARPAAALFTLDGLTLSLALTATNAGGTVSEVVSFASSARGFNGLGLSLHLTTALLRPETELFAAADSRLTIWHNDGKEESYELSGLDSQLFAADAGGGVRVASNLPVSGEGAFYELTLRLTDGAANAERLLFLRLTPPLPEIEGELSGETKLVNALSGSGTALLAVTVSNGGALLSFADTNGFASGGGAVAVISLVRSAAALFTLDGLTLSLALTATNAGGTVSETVSFVSSARGFDGLGLSLHLTTALLHSETELFAARDANLTIWHNDGKEESYELSGLDSQLFAAGADGGVRVASDLPVSGEGAFYELTLRLTDGAANAERLLFLRLTPPLPEIEGELLGETQLVNALSGSGTALLVVTVSNGGELSSFADANGFTSDGGAVAVISLARPAAALFTLDGLTLSLALTATNAGGTVSATVSFASSARGFDGLGLTLHLTTALLGSGTELFAAADSRLTIWHNDSKEESYKLSGLDSELFVASADGGVRVAGDLPVSGEGAFYELTLRLTDGAANAERLLFLRLTPPLPEIEGVSDETKLVNALSGSGTALLAVTVSNGGALLSFTDANGFASGGGAVAVISLARSATALFTLDGLTLSLALTATNAGGTVSATVSFASSARGFDGLGLSLHLTTALLRPETELFAATDANLTIWHNGGKEESYELSGLDSELFAAGADGGVRVAADLPVSGEGAFYELILRLTDGAAVAKRLLFLRLTPPLPEIEGELLGETKLVDALSGSGTALLAVTVSNGGELSPIADANGFASEGGAVAVISLARSAAALFTLDGLTLSLALTATNAGGTVSATVSFASSARGFDGLGLSLHLTTALLHSETELFAATDSRLTIWHNGGKEESYELSGLDSELFVASADGGVRVAADLPVSGEGAFYELILRLTDGAANAERLLFLRLTPPLPEIEGELLGETKLVDALSGSGTALLAVTVSNGGALLSFSDANGFASGGGAIAVISLARPATALFTLDGLTLSLALTATNAGGTVSATVSFASSARGFDGLGLSLHLTTVLLRPETELFAAADASLTIWHNDGKEENYELSGLDSELFATGADGGVRVGSDLPVSGEGAFYELTLRLTDGAAIAERLLFLRLTPPLPEIEGELLGETKLVDALSGSGTALLAVTVSNGGALLSFSDANGFASGGGAIAVISLARPATALFTLDGLTLSLALTATNAGGTVSETVSFASSARGFDGLGLSLHLTTVLLRPETELFAATDSRLTIWHNDGKKESYELSGLDSQLFAAGADGGVRVGSDLPVSGEGVFYELTLRLTDGAAIAERLLFLRLTPPRMETPPLPEIEGELLGETKLVDALSGSGTALLAVTVSNGGELSPIADANGFASEGGAVAVISLARSAAALFTLDGLTLSLALTATNAGGTVSETVSFVSSALGIDGAGLFASFATVILPSETEVFAAADARLTIWHNGGKQETYELAGADASLFAVDVNGGVRTASDLSSSEDDLLYELTLRLTDESAIAERLLTLALLPPPIAVDVVAPQAPPLPNVGCTGQWPCRDQFAAALAAAIESGEATLDHERAVVIDNLRRGGHGEKVHFIAQRFGSGATVRLLGNGYFPSLPAKKKLIVNYSQGRLLAYADGLKEKDAVVVQGTGNQYRQFPGAPLAGETRSDVVAAAETGLMIIAGGIAKTSERYRRRHRTVPIDLNDPSTFRFADFCHRSNGWYGSEFIEPGPPSTVTISGEEWCSIYDRCGWMQNYCFVAPAKDIVYNDLYGYTASGTFGAVPQGTAALQMLGTMWPELSSRELALMLLELADDVGELGIDDVYGHGALSFRRLYAPDGLSPFIVGGEAFRFSCDADANTCQKERLERP